MTNLRDKTIIIYDRGAYSYIAQFMAHYYGKVQYHNPSVGLYEKSPLSQIGKGLIGVDWLEDFWAEIVKIVKENPKEKPVIFFPYIYDGSKQEALRLLGFPVCGSGMSEKMELNKLYYKQQVEKYMGAKSVIRTYLAKGLDDVREYLKNRDHAVLKNLEKYRGDFETFTHDNPHETEAFLLDVEYSLGVERAKEIAIGIEKFVDIDCETGCDGFRLDDQMAPNMTVGYEIKDKGYVMRVFEKAPPPIKKVNDALGPVYKRLGYRGPYSNEMIITKDGRIFPIDDTTRCGSPPTPSLIELYGKYYAQGVYDLAHGVMPSGDTEWKYGAEIILSSTWHIKNQLWVGCPKNFDRNLKLHNGVMKRGEYYCIPDLTEDSSDEFGSVVGVGNTLKEAITKATDAIKELHVHDLSYKEGLFDECEEVIEKGRKHGIQF